jgi:hypothetical protein
MEASSGVNTSLRQQVRGRYPRAEQTTKVRTPHSFAPKEGYSARDKTQDDCDEES